MTDEQIIEVMAKAIYEAKGCAVPWEQALEWLGLEKYSTPALDVKRCRLHATAALAALKAAGLVVVPVEPSEHMMVDGARYLEGCDWMPQDEKTKYVRAVYRAMISAQEG